MDAFLHLGMTAASTPSPFVAAASSHVGANDAWQAFADASVFDSSSNSYFSSSGAGSAWISIDLGTTYRVASYSILPFNPVSGGYAPKDWTFEGSTTGAFGGEQVTLDTRTSQTGWANRTLGRYVISAPASYRYYRLNMSANNGSVFFGLSQLLLALDTTASSGGSTRVISRGMLGPLGR